MRNLWLPVAYVAMRLRWLAGHRWRSRSFQQAVLQASRREGSERIDPVDVVACADGETAARSHWLVSLRVGGG